MEKCKLVHCLVQESKKKDDWLKNKRLATPLSDDAKDDTQHTIETLPSQNIGIQTLRYIVNGLLAGLKIDVTQTHVSVAELVLNLSQDHPDKSEAKYLIVRFNGVDI